MDFVRGDVIVDFGGAERVYMRLEHYWTVSPNSSNWYPTDEAMQAKIDNGESVFIGNRKDLVA
jgi:hypothetical protein